MPKMTKSSGNEYISNGVTIIPSTPGVGENVKLIYDGILAKSGARHVYAHIGYGSNWSSTNDFQMNKTGTGFEAAFNLPKTDTVNVCFKDCANNWDNNSGMNYVFDIS